MRVRVDSARGAGTALGSSIRGGAFDIMQFKIRSADRNPVAFAVPSGLLVESRNRNFSKSDSAQAALRVCTFSSGVRRVSGRRTSRLKQNSQKKMRRLHNKLLAILHLHACARSAVNHHADVQNRGTEFEQFEFISFRFRQCVRALVEHCSHTRLGSLRLL